MILVVIFRILLILLIRLILIHLESVLSLYNYDQK